MKKKIEQKTMGKNNIQAGRDLTQNHIHIFSILSDPSFPQDLDQALHQSILSLEKVQKQLTDAEEKIYLWLSLFVVAVLIACVAVLGGFWAQVILGLSVVAFSCYKITRPIKNRAIIKLDIKAHQDVVGELCKRKVLARIGATN